MACVRACVWGGWAHACHLCMRLWGDRDTNILSNVGKFGWFPRQCLPEACNDIFKEKSTHCAPSSTQEATA